MKTLRLTRHKSATETKLDGKPLSAKAKHTLTAALGLVGKALLLEEAEELLGGRTVVAWPDNGEVRYGLITGGTKSAASVVELLVSCEDETDANDYPLMGYRLSGKSETIASAALTEIALEELGDLDVKACSGKQAPGKRGPNEDQDEDEDGTDRDSEDGDEEDEDKDAEPEEDEEDKPKKKPSKKGKHDVSKEKRDPKGRWTAALSGIKDELRQLKDHYSSLGTSEMSKDHDKLSEHLHNLTDDLGVTGTYDKDEDHEDADKAGLSGIRNRLREISEWVKDQDSESTPALLDIKDAEKFYQLMRDGADEALFKPKKKDRWS